MSSATIVHFPATKVPPVQRSGGTLRPDPAHLARLQAIAFKLDGQLTDMFMLQVLRRAGETRSPAEARSYHPDALPTLYVARVLSATLERIAGQEMTDAQRVTATAHLWPIAEGITAHSDEAVPHALAATIAHFIRLNLPQEAPHDRP